MKAIIFTIAMILFYKKKRVISSTGSIPALVFSVCSLLFVLLITVNGFAQNVGIGVPTPLQKLDVGGAVKIGTTTTNQAGTVRFNAGKFEGGDGTNWKSLEGLPGGAVVLSDKFPNSDLQDAGYTYIGFSNAGTKKDSVLNLPASRWLPVSLNGAPVNVKGYSGITINNDFFIFGGTQNGITTNQGFLYNKNSDKWETVTTENAPTPRTAASLVFTGTDIIVIGGNSYGIPANFYGAKYNLSSKIWTPIPSLNAPTERSSFTTVWTGTELILWGGGYYLNSGARYNPATNIWTAMSTINAPSARNNARAVWTGTEMIIWGGYDAGTDDITNGAKYNPSTNTWTTISTINAPLNKISFGTVLWTGTEMIIWGGRNNLNVDIQTGARYNPGTNVWTVMSIVNAPTARSNFNAAWTGTQMIVWGGANVTASGARYTASTNSWSVISTVNAPPTRQNYQSCWSGTLFIVWGGTTPVVDPDYGNIFKDFNDGYAYNNSTGTWSKLTQGNAPSERHGNAVSGLIFYWAGNCVIVWAGTKENSVLDNTEPLYDGGRYFFTAQSGYTYYDGGPVRYYLYKKN